MPTPSEKIQAAMRELADAQTPRYENRGERPLFAVALAVLSGAGREDDSLNLPTGRVERFGQFIVSFSDYEGARMRSLDGYKSERSAIAEMRRLRRAEK